jgi:O-antigen/teichoic acid export membrane protein/glycosyltransferase involved in cell wall biosynthesis
MAVTQVGTSLTTRTIQATQWRVVGAVVNAVSQLVVGVLLTRLLTPADFGITALALIVLRFGRLLADLGIGSAIVQRPELTNRQVRTAFTFATLAGLLVATAMVLVAPLGGAAMHDANVTPVLRMLATVFAIRGTAVVADALLRRHLDFRQQVLIETGSYVLGYGGVAVTLALLGRGVWSLVWGGIVQTLAASIAQLAVVRHPMRPLLAPSELRPLLRFGVGAALAAAVNYVALNGDYLVVGRWMGAADLGLYSRAYALMNLPQTYAAAVMSGVMFPAFSRAQEEPARVRSGFLLATRLTAMVAAPAMTSLAIAAPHFVRGLYGPQWSGMILPLQVLAIAGYFRALYHLGGTTAHSLGQVYGDLWRQVMYAAFVIGGAAVGSRYGLMGVAVGVSLAILYMFVATGHLALRATHTTWRVYLRVQVDAVVTALCTGAAALLARLSLESLGMSAGAIALGVVTAAALPWSVGLLWTMGASELEPVRMSLPHRWQELIESARRLTSGTPKRTTQSRTAASRCHVLIERRSESNYGLPGEIRAFAKCRNERLRLPAFLQHYRALGVDRFFIVDNNSSDGTTEYLTRQPDVRVFRTSNRFRESSAGSTWLNALLSRFGVGVWCVTVDIDELLVYPGSERSSLRELTTHLDRSGSEALSCLMLDLYPAGPLRECSYNPGDDLIAAAPYFDAGPYERSLVDKCPGVFITGGMRERVFYPHFRARGATAKAYDALLNAVRHHLPIVRDVSWLRERRRRRPPLLTKVPLVRWDEQSMYLNSPHWVSPKIVAPETGVLLHFKFLHDFSDRATREAARREYYDDATEYRRYAETLTQNPDLSFTSDESKRFDGTSQLVSLGLMRDTEAWVHARNIRIE